MDLFLFDKNHDIYKILFKRLKIYIPKKTIRNKYDNNVSIILS